MAQKSAARVSKRHLARTRGAFLINLCARYLDEERRRGTADKRTARMFDDRATPRSPFVVAYSPRSHPNTPTGSSLSSTLRHLPCLLNTSMQHEFSAQKSKIGIKTGFRDRASPATLNTI